MWNIKVKFWNLTLIATAIFTIVFNGYIGSSSGYTIIYNQFINNTNLKFFFKKKNQYSNVIVEYEWNPASTQMSIVINGYQTMSQYNTNSNPYLQKGNFKQFAKVRPINGLTKKPC